MTHHGYEPNPTTANRHDINPHEMRATPANWREQALCAADPNPDRWVDLPAVRVRGKNNPNYDALLTELTATCDECPVRALCLNEALPSNAKGVFAGTDEYKRADMREELGMVEPDPLIEPENEEDARVMAQQFNALRLARRGLSNQEIASELGVSAMTVSRLTASDDKPASRRTRTKSA